jgi:hypothetical protein
MTTLKSSVRVTLCILATFATQASLQAQTQQIKLDRQVGEIFVAIGNGQYQVWHPAPPSATLVETITQNFNGNLSGATAGCAFDATYHPFTTNLTNGDVLRHGIDDPQTGIEEISVLGGQKKGGLPTSVAFDSSGNAYIGNAGGNGLIQEYSPSGSFLRTLPVGTSKLKGGAAWIDLSADSKTIYFSNGSNTISQFSVSSSKISKFASTSGASFFALRVLPAALSNGGILLAAAVFSGSSSIELFNAQGTVVQTYSVSGEDNFQVLTLDPNGTSFWAGNPSSVSRNFYRINLATGNLEVSVNTGVTSGPSGLCAYGGFSAALYQPIKVTASYTSSSSPGCAVNAQNSSLADCTFSTLLPPPTPPAACPNNHINNCFGITLTGIDFNHAPNGLQLTYNYSQIPPGAGTSDTGLPCAPTSPGGTKCEVHSVDVNPTNTSSNPPDIYQGFDTDIFSVQSTLNPVVLKNEGPGPIVDAFHEITDFVIHGTTRVGGSDTTKSIFTVNEQPVQITGSQSCGYISPLLNSQYNQGRTIPFKFVAVSPPNTCPNGPNFLTTLSPRLVLVQLTNLTTLNAAPHRVDFTLSDGTSCTEASPCHFRLDPSSGTWILNVDTSTLQGGGTAYLGTTIDDSNQIPSFSTTQFGQTDIFSIQ